MIQVQDVYNRKTYSATVIGYDVAVLQLKGATGLKTVQIANSSSVKVGAKVVRSETLVA